MSDINETIKKVNDKMIEDGTIENIIREKLAEAYSSAVKSVFQWGDVKDAIEKKLKSVLVPAIEKYDLSEYAVKLDDVLSEIVRQTAIPDSSTILENFSSVFREKLPDTVTLDDLMDRYMDYCKSDLDCAGREVNTEEGPPVYENCEISVSVTDDKRHYGRFANEYALLLFQIGEDEDESNKEKLNRCVNLTHYSWERDEGWRIEYGNNAAIKSLRHMNSFDVYLLALSQNGTRVIAEKGDSQEDEFEPDDEPECSWS